MAANATKTTNSLLAPDRQSWRVESGYSVYIAGQLAVAYGIIRKSKGTVKGYARASRLLFPLRKYAMSGHQRLNLYFIIAMAVLADSRYRRAHIFLARALSLADVLHDTGAQIELLQHRAGTNRAMGRVVEAADDIADCCALLEHDAGLAALYSADFRIHLLTSLATYQFVAARHDELLVTLNDIKGIKHTGSDEVQVDLAHLEWVYALRSQFDGQPFDAWKHALNALAFYERLPDTCSKDRLFSLIGDIELDMATQLKDGSAQRDLLIRAHRRFHQSRRISAKAQDDSGRLLAELGHTRYLLMTKPSLALLQTLESIQATAAMLPDDILVGHALIALGDAHRVLTTAANAAEYYRKAMTHFHGAQARVYHMIARRKLVACDP